MAFYQSDNQVLYLSVLRTSPIIDEGAIGGLFSIDANKHSFLFNALKALLCYSILSFFVVLYKLRDGWPLQEVDELIIGFFGISPLFLLALAILFASRERKMIILKDNILELCHSKFSKILHYIIVMISFNILCTFLFMSLQSNANDFESILLLLLNLFWISYFILSLRNLLRIVTLENSNTLT